MKEKIKSSIASVGAQKLGAHFGLQNVKASAFYHLNDQFKRRQNLFREFHLLLSLLPCPKAPYGLSYFSNTNLGQDRLLVCKPVYGILGTMDTT